MRISKKKKRAALISQLVIHLQCERQCLIPGLERSPGEAKGYPLQYSGLENSMDYTRPWGLKESDMTEQLSFSKKNITVFCWLAIVSPEVYLNERRR